MLVLVCVLVLGSNGKLFWWIIEMLSKITLKLLGFLRGKAEHEHAHEHEHGHMKLNRPR